MQTLKDDTRQRILSVARNVFIVNGVRCPSIRTMANKKERYPHIDIDISPFFLHITSSTWMNIFSELVELNEYNKYDSPYIWTRCGLQHARMERTDESVTMISLFFQFHIKTTLP